MAEAALLQIVCENLNSLIQSEVGLFLGVEKDMEKLSSVFSTIRAVLEDAELKQFNDKAIQNWLRKLKVTAYDVDDILDACATEALRLQFQTQNSGSGGLLNKVHTSFLTCTFHLQNVVFRFKIGKRMKDTRERLDAIAGERMKFHLREGVVEIRRFEAMGSRETGSILTQPQVYGREKDIERTVEALVKDVSSCENLSIYPVIGMGGLGKTTLAQLVFNDERVKDHFEMRIWVCVSDDFDVKRLIKAIIESASGGSCEVSELEPLQRRLQELLTGKKYLVVLDDVWNEDQEKWDRLKCVLACGSNGAAVITTTRLEKVAMVMGTLPPHPLSVLSEDDCWSLFRQRAFGNEAEELPKLVAIGKEIVSKCGGVPLAAKALGGLMRFKRAENEWLFVKESEIWNLPQDDECSILPALRLSYYNLPLELRQCFSFCALFPKDSDIEKEHIIQLWMANGLISSNEKLELEDIGNEIWNQLYWRSFFQDVKKDDDGNITSFKMHDLVHDLAQSVVEDECCIMEPGKSINFSKRIRHVSLVCRSWKSHNIPEALYKVESLRTFLPQKEVQNIYSNDIRFNYSTFGFSLLRVLVVECGVTELPSSIGKLKHLRYFDLSWTKIKVLPASICSLWNLQTLKLVHCRDLQSLPKHLSRLRNLRHLYMDGCAGISEMPPNIGELTCLKTLTFFIVGVGERRGFLLSELKGLNLRGGLCIKNLGRVKDPKDAKEANLGGKHNLRRLEFVWKTNDENYEELQEKVLEALEPHSNLESLSIYGYKGAYFPLWLRRNLILQNAVRIELSDCTNCSELPPFAKLPCLRTLYIRNMSHVEYIDNESYGGGGAMKGFPSLETLNIYGLPNLKRLSREEGRELLPHLTKLHITSCPKLTLPLCLLSLKELTVWSCNGEVLLSSISNLHSLTSLEVDENDQVISFPDGMLRNLTSLQRLQIKSFTNLQALPTDLEGLTSLQYLTVRRCEKLKSLSEGLQYLTTLESLEVIGCPDLVAFPEGIKQLNSLRTLLLSGSGVYYHSNVCPKLVVLPEALQHVTTLQHLTIRYYPELASLPEWLGNLTSLQSLEIERCPKIASLPASIQNLTQLQKLRIRECPQLERRCEKERGEDWCYISHIPKVTIGIN